MLSPPSPTQTVGGISPEIHLSITHFFLANIDRRVQHEDGPFSLRKLFGGADYPWATTPLHAVFLKHRDRGLSDYDANTATAKDAGRKLKEVLADHPQRTFRYIRNGRVAHYQEIRETAKA